MKRRLAVITLGKPYYMQSSVMVSNEHLKP